MEITEKVAYLKGLAEGMELDTEKKEGKLLAAIIDVLDDIALEIADMKADQEELYDGLDAVSDDLEDVEDAVFAIPPVSAPSPITEITEYSSPVISRAWAIPSPAEIEVELCPVSNASYGLSFRFGNPLIPPNWRRSSNPAFLPLKSLWV